MLRWALALAIFTWGCGSNQQSKVGELLKAGDRAGALSILEKIRETEPDNLDVRSTLFVIYQHQVSQGDPAREDAYLKAAIVEYSHIAGKNGIQADYKDMEGSLKSNQVTKAAYEAAYAAVYAR